MDVAGPGSAFRGSPEAREPALCRRGGDFTSRYGAVSSQDRADLGDAHVDFLLGEPHANGERPNARRAKLQYLALDLGLNDGTSAACRGSFLARHRSFRWASEVLPFVEGFAPLRGRQRPSNGVPKRLVILGVR